MFQRHRSCAFDTPGLPNDSAGYPGFVDGVHGTTPSVLRFLSVIHHIFWRKKNMNLDPIPSPLRIRIFVTANGLMGNGGVVAN